MPRIDNILCFNPSEETLLLEFLLKAMPERSRTSVKQFLAHDQVAVNGSPTRQFDTPLAPGDRVEVNTTRPFVVFHHRRLQLVYEDDAILVVNKGYGLLSVAAPTRKTDRPSQPVETAYSILRDYIKANNPANKIFVVHRLDRDTSGLMMYAKSVEAKEAMQHNWNNMVLRRTYVAVVKGIVEEDEGMIRSYLRENAQHEMYSSPVPVKGAKEAVTRWKVLRRGKGHTLLELELDTGRKNQIRVQLKDMGHPIVGDHRYGGGLSPIHRLCLHARTLRFAHPVTRALMDFETPVPQAFMKLV